MTQPKTDTNSRLSTSAANVRRPMDPDIPVRYIRENFRSDDRIAVVLIQKETHRVVQRVATAERVASPEFQAWLRHENAGRFEVYVSMNALKEGSRSRTSFLPRKVIVPARIGLDVIVEEGGRITFAPEVDGVQLSEMHKAFLGADDVDQVYSLDDGSGGRVRVVLDDEQREVLRRMQRVHQEVPSAISFYAIRVHCSTV